MQLIEIHAHSVSQGLQIEIAAFCGGIQIGRATLTPTVGESVLPLYIEELDKPREVTCFWPLLIMLIRVLLAASYNLL